MRSATAISTALVASFAQGQFNNPPDVDIWCGKAYRATNASFNPGGWFEEPDVSKTALLNFVIAPGKSLYLEGESSGSLLVEASISHQIGQPLPAAHAYSIETNPGNWTLDVTYFMEGNATAFGNASAVSIGAKIVHPLDFSIVPARATPYNISAVAKLHGSNKTFYASTQIIRLPVPSDNRTVTRLDNQFGGLEYSKAGEENWRSIFPHTYYVQWSLYWYANLSTLNEFASMGYNVIHIVPTGDLGDTPYPWKQFEPYLNRADELGLLLQFDVRWDYSNLTLMTEIVSNYASHPAILLWYTGDEPDGKSDPINSTAIAYNIIKTIDPYHPVSLALNCYDFYYSSYASGADVILSDVYPISTNTSWSTQYDTPCNATYGCCGCDDCHGSFTDISDRLDQFKHFDEVLGWQKTHWGAPQAFGNETFWTRYPTAAEEVVMNMISINHGAKGIVMWDFPTTAEVLNVTNRLAAILTSQEATQYLTSAALISALKVEGVEGIDASAWLGRDGLMLSVINLNYGNANGTVTVHLPSGISGQSIKKTLWGSTNWQIDGSTITTDLLLGLEASLVVLDMN